MIELRQYQRDAIDGIYRYYESGNVGNPLVVCPTGSGKSVIIAKFCEEVIKAWPEQKIVILSHRKEILQQNASKILKIWPEASLGIWSAGLNQRRIRQITLAGIQSVYQRAELFGPIDLIIIDECHLVSKSGDGMYLKFIAEARRFNPKLKIIGLTATPYRLDGGLLTDGNDRIFTDIAYEIELVRLIKEGFLSLLVSKNPETQADLSKVRTRGGEFVSGEVEEAFDRTDLTASAISEMKRLAPDRQSWLVFCSGVDHTKHVCEALNLAGISTKYVTGETLPMMRQNIIAQFRRGEIRALCNCDVLTTGFDAPNIDAVILLRSTQSPGLFVQICGRGSRLSPNKKNCLVLDFGGNIMRHGPIDMITIKSKKDREKVPGIAPVKTCQTCRLVVPIQIRICPECGTEFPRAEKHEREASTVDILSAFKASISELTIDEVSYQKHIKQKTGSESFRVDYRSGPIVISEWLLFDAVGYARARACQWWHHRTNYSTRIAPQTIDEALDRACELKKPTTIKAHKDKDGYWRILNLDFAPTPESIAAAEGRKILEEIGVY